MMTGLCSVLILCAFSFVPVLTHHSAPTKESSSNWHRIMQSLIYLPNWRNKKFLIWTFTIPLAVFGYWVSILELPNLTRQEDIMMVWQLSICLELSSSLGRLITGFLADYPPIRRNGNRILLQQISIVTIGVCSTLVSFITMIRENEFLVS